MSNKILPGIFFVLLAVWVCFIGGLFVGGLVTPKSAGLAGGATVFFYGVIGGILALLFGSLAARQASLSTLKKMLIGVGVLTLLSGVWIGFRVIQKNAEKQDQPEVSISHLSKGESGDIPQAWSFMNSVAVKGDWLQVELIKGGNEILGLAWIQWRKDGQLWVSWSMLS